MGLEIETAEQPGVSQLSAGRYAVEFDVGFFSTPMIDNTRLSNDQRVAVVLTDMNSAGASLSLVYFPRVTRELARETVLRGESSRSFRIPSRGSKRPNTAESVGGNGHRRVKAVLDAQVRHQAIILPSAIPITAK
jgi:hypothetical protein